MKGMTCFENKIMAGTLIVSLIFTALALPVGAFEGRQNGNYDDKTDLIETISEEDETWLSSKDNEFSKKNISEENKNNYTEDIENNFKSAIDSKLSISLDSIVENFDKGYGDENENMVGGDIEYLIDTDHYYEVGQVKVIPDAYWADFYFTASLDPDSFSILFCEEKDVDWRPDKTFILEKDLGDIRVGSLENTDYWSDRRNWLAYENYGRLYGDNNSLKPLTEYQYRIVYKNNDIDGEPGYYFMTVPQKFVTMNGKTNSEITFSDICIESGSNSSDLSCVISNPNKAKIVNVYFKGKCEDGSDILVKGDYFC